MFSFLFLFWVSGRFGGEASRPPDSVSRGRWLGVRGWWRVWCSGRQALLSPGVMRPCRVASDGYIFFGCGLSLSSSSYRAVLAFSPSVFLCFIGYSHAAPSGAAPFERIAVTLLPGALASVSFPFRSRRLFWDLSGGRHGRPGIRRPGRHARPFV